MFIEIRKIKRLQKDGTRTCHAKQWPTPPSSTDVLGRNAVSTLELFSKLSQLGDQTHHWSVGHSDWELALKQKFQLGEK